jgi:hypothetical protein
VRVDVPEFDVDAEVAQRVSDTSPGRERDLALERHAAGED